MSNLAEQIDNRHQDYESVARLIELHNRAAPEAKNLQSIARHMNFSDIQVKLLFSRWAGISPNRFSQYLTPKNIRERLNHQHSLLDPGLDAGLSGSSLVHAHFVHFYAMSPKQVREQGAGITISHGFYESPFGDCHIGMTHKGICWLAFIDPVSREESTGQLKNEWPGAQLDKDRGKHQGLVDSLFSAVTEKKPLFLHIKGTNFQLRVWEALLKIPAGHCTRYQDIARKINMPHAARSVGTAIGRNPVSWLIPCHRVIRATGIVGHYRWGKTRKQSLLVWEQGAFIGK